MILEANEAGRQRIVFVAEDISPIAGGVPAVVRQLSERIGASGIETHVVHCRGSNRELGHSAVGHSVPAQGIGQSWGLGKGLRRTLEALAEGPEDQAIAYHLHGIWSAPQFMAARIARSRQVPYIVSAHGMLEPWLWNNQGWKVKLKKRLYWTALAFPAFRSATVVHAITPIERDHLRALFPQSRIEIIPNAIEVPATGFGSAKSILSRKILFLGRIEPKKGVDLLLGAFCKARLGREWRLLIAGPSWSNSYLSRIKALAVELQIDERVEFLGHVQGSDKYALLRESWVMATPSHSEVIGLVNLEAGAHELPAITTPQSGLFDWEEGGGVLVQPVVNDLAIALSQACAWSDAERADRGRASYRLVRDRYSWGAILPRWMELYNSLFD